jgi:phosphoglycerate dehydrogenase-like enzyme
MSGSGMTGKISDGGKPPFTVSLSADFFEADGALKYRDIGLGLLEEAGIRVARFDQHVPEIRPEQFAGASASIVLTPRVTAGSLAAAENLLAIARFGVGYDSVDVAACTAADVLLLITSGAVDRPVAEATVGWMIALAHQVRIKDRLVREARWDERSRYMGGELREKTLGIIGFGGIGRALVALLSGFGMQPPLVFDPLVSDVVLSQAGARRVSLEELLSQSDFVSLHCPLNDKTRNLIGPAELSRMKPTAFLLNTARGGIIDEDALFAALANKKIAGAALDCFVSEPLTVPSRFAQFDNVLLAPHCIAWTDELFRDIGRTACRSLIDLTQHKRPPGAVNPEVFNRPTFVTKWTRLCPR